MNPVLAIVGAGAASGRAVLQTSHFVEVALLLQSHVLQIHSSEAAVDFSAPAPHPVKPVLGVADTGFDAGFGVSHTSHLVEVALLWHIHVEHCQVSLVVVFGVMPVPHPVKPVVGGTAALVGVACDSLKAKVKVGN